MMLLTETLRRRLRANAGLGDGDERDPVPVVKFFAPVGAATWLATELDADGDTLFGLADLGCSCPELGSFSLRELASLRLPLGLGIERDRHFVTERRLSEWAEVSSSLGSIMLAEQHFRRARDAGGPGLSGPND